MGEQNPVMDKVIVRVIATVQLVMSLAGLLMLPFAFMYGGAAAWPSAFQGALLYLFCGFGSAIFLYSRRLAARALAVVWHAVLVGYLFVGLFASARTTPGTFSLLFFWSVLSLCYLALTSIPSAWAAAKKNPKAAKYAIPIGLAAILIVASFHYFSYDSIASLETQLHSPNSDVRCVAARRLASKGPAAKSALPALRSMLDNTICVDSGEYADDTTADIEKIGGIDPLIDVMRNGSSIGRGAAAWHLRNSIARHADRATDLKQAFAAGLKSNDDLVRQASVEGLGVLGPKAAGDLLPELQRLVDDPSAQVRSSVVKTIGMMSSVGDLREVLANPDQQIRSEAIQELASARYGAAAIPALESALNDRSAPNASQAATALGNLGRQALPALGSLERAGLHSADPWTRMAAIHALKQIGPEGLPTIEKAVQDDDVHVRDHAIALLGSYGQAGAPALASFLDQPWTSSTTKAVNTLESLGPEALPALNALERTALNSPDKTTRVSAISALAKIGPPGYPAVAKLSEDPDPEVRAKAQSWLKSLRARYPSLHNSVK